MKKVPIQRLFLIITLVISLFSVSLITGTAATKAKINKKKATILVSKTIQLKIQGQKKVKWSSSNKKVAKVSKAGKVTGKKPGKATITAKVKGKTYKCKVKVQIGLDKKKITLNIGESVKIKLCGSKIKTVKSSNKRVATITKKGVIKAMGEGKAILTITGKNKKRYKCSIAVTKSSNKTPNNSDNSSVSKKNYQVIFDTKGGSDVPSQEVEEGKKATIPNPPTYEGYTFIHWELDGKEFDFTTPINSNIILKAKWDKKDWENAAEIKEIIEANKSEQVPSESSVIDILKDRGFEEYIPTYSYTLDGDYCGEMEVQDGSSERRPMYQTYYIAESGDAWTIYVNNGAIFAYPISYNLESDREILVSESAEIVSYDDISNQFFITTPDDSSIIIKVVDRIDAETLYNMTIDDIKK